MKIYKTYNWEKDNNDRINMYWYVNNNSNNH